MILKTFITIIRYIFLILYWLFIFTYTLLFVYCIRFTVFIYLTWFHSFTGWAKAGVIFLHIIGCLIGYLILFVIFGLIGEVPKLLKKYSYMLFDEGKNTSLSDL
jgi:hypothetical protein